MRYWNLKCKKEKNQKTLSYKVTRYLLQHIALKCWRPFMELLASGTSVAERPLLNINAERERERVCEDKDGSLSDIPAPVMTRAKEASL